MNVAKRHKYTYVRAEKGTEVPKKPDEDVRVKKFSEMQEAGDFYDYVYSLPNVQNAIEKYSLETENTFNYPHGTPQMDAHMEKVRAGIMDEEAPTFTAPKISQSDVEFLRDSESVGPLTEGALAVRDRFRLNQEDKYGVWAEGFEKNVNDYVGPIKQKHIIKELKAMYPNEPNKTFETSAGIAKMMAKRARDRFTYSQNFTTDNYLGEGVYGAVQPSNSSGSQRRPFIMGMADVQKRGRDSIMLDPNSPEGTTVHEMSHAGDFKTNAQSQYMRSLINWGKASSVRDNYMYQPTEIRARLMEVREQLYKNGIRDPKDTYTVEDVSKVGDDLLGLKNLRKIYDDESIAELLNNAY